MGLINLSLGFGLEKRGEACVTFNFNDLFQAYIGGMKADKLWVRVWLFFKGKEYRIRRRNVLIYQYKKKARKTMMMLASTPPEGRLMSKVLREPRQVGSSFPVPVKRWDSENV